MAFNYKHKNGTLMRTRTEEKKETPIIKQMAIK